MVDEVQDNTEVTEEEQTIEPEVKEPEIDPRDAKIDALEADNLRQRTEFIELQRRMDETEEMLANPDQYTGREVHDTRTDASTAHVDYNELDQNQFANTLKAEIAKEVGRLIDEKEAPRLKAQSIREQQDKRKEDVKLSQEIQSQVQECAKLENWDRYKSKIQQEAEAYQAEFGTKALVKSNLIKKTYADLRLADAKNKVTKQNKSGSTSEKPSTSASAAEAPKTMKSAFMEAWENLTPEERETVT